MAKSITLYDNCDVYIHRNDIELYGYDKTFSLEEMIHKATEHKCNIIIKNGKGKWYLKGTGKEYGISKCVIENNVGKYPRRKCWLIEF